MFQFHEICTFFFFDNWQEGWTPLHCAGNIFDFTKTIQLKYHLIFLISRIFFIDDFEAIHPNSESGHHHQQSRYNSAVHIRIYHNPKPMEVVTDGQEQ